MPSGGYRPKKPPADMEQVDCKGAGSLIKPHTFLRPIGSSLRQCDRCFEASSRIHIMPVFHDLSPHNQRGEK